MQGQQSLKHLVETYAAGSHRFLIWCGAGIGAYCGLPNWSELHKFLVQTAKNKAVYLPTKEEREIARRRIEAAQNVDDFWVAFDLLSKQLGPTDFRSAIKAQLDFPDVSKIHPILSELWSLKVGGIITLNLDPTLKRGFYQTTPGKLLNEAVGTRLSAQLNILSEPRRFLVNLHGVVSDPSTWVLTSEDREKLLGSASYRTFLDNVFVSWKILFVGISAHDVMAGGHLNILKSLGYNFGEHFWLTSKNEKSVLDWASQVGVQTILYDQKTTSHDAALRYVIEGMKGYVPPEIQPDPIDPAVDFGPDLPPISSVRQFDPEKARKIVSSHLSNILQNSENPRDDYFKFMADHVIEINHASLVTEAPPNNVLYGHRLDKNLGGGAFGRVYKADRGAQQFVAVKLLKREVQDDQAMLDSFRRGVQSMRILSQKKVSGMVEYFAGFEVPPCVIMEYIDGQNLQDLVSSKRILPDVLALRLVRRVASIVHSAHVLPERVLHRDIRPSNIMVKRNFQDSSFENDIVVLDFDLSWHEGAEDHEISPHMTTVLGYLAPEQLSPKPSVSTRVAQVDVFGICMTLFYILSRRHPEPNEAASDKWRSTVALTCAAFRSPEWKSVPLRLSRLIQRGTEVDQAARCDMLYVIEELGRIIDEIGGKIPTSVEHLLDEFGVRTFGVDRFQLDSDRAEIIYNRVAGLKVSVRSSNDNWSQIIELEIVQVESGSTDRGNLTKYWERNARVVAESLESVGWSVANVSSDRGGSVNVRASINVDEFARKLDPTSVTVTRILQKLSG
jgi:serine/threonine protein kinase